MYRIEIFHPGTAEGFCDFFGCYHACHWVAIAHGFSHCDNVWNEVFTMHLEAPEMFPNSAKAHLNFVGYKHASRSVYVSEKQKGSLTSSGHRESPNPPTKIQTMEDLKKNVNLRSGIIVKNISVLKSPVTSM